MRSVVCFRTGAAGATYCLPVQVTRAVRSRAGLRALPAPRRDIAGILPGDPPLTVISSLGADGSHVLVVEAGGRSFGLLVDVVTGVVQVDDEAIRDAPRGQAHPLISGTVQRGGEMLLLADADALAEAL